MSPLSVSMLRPPTSWFDVVIFDEASQIPPADAITSIKAAKQMVVAGDSLQLPPTPFFAAGDTQMDDPFDDEDFEETSKSLDYESILDFVKIIIPKYRQLRWHYRSRDERLIAFSNHKLYKSLIAFPYAEADTTLKHVSIPPSDRSKGKGASNPAEVAKVVELVTQHALDHPGESLGVIALGLKHSVAIEDALNTERLLNQQLDSFLNDDHDGEPFFVKNLERVQGDERDAIILSIGYGRGESGQVKYTFGPILGAKGERRLNVATTRAKLRMTTVAAFSSSDLDISKTSRGGAAFLREYLAFVESGGNDLPDKGSTRVEMNPFEQSVFDQLSRRGVQLIPQYGVGNYRLDFAVQNPHKPGTFILAIECDGRSYHSFPTARERDRLREAALRQRGWDFHRIWSDHWFANPEVEVERALGAIERRLSEL
jgi:very-short-patch-repair endonuclease